MALDLLDDSLEFCRGKVRVKPVRGAFAALMEKHLRLLRVDLQLLDVALEVDVPAELQVVLDPERMARVLRNLARNAGEALHGRATRSSRSAHGRSRQAWSCSSPTTARAFPRRFWADCFSPSARMENGAERDSGWRLPGNWSRPIAGRSRWHPARRARGSRSSCPPKPTDDEATAE